MTYVYIRSEPALWTVGFYGPDGQWKPESDHGSPEDAASRVAWLNGDSPAEFCWIVGVGDASDRIYGVYTTEHAADRVVAANPGAESASIALDRTYPVAGVQASPWPLAEGDRVRLTLDAEVFARPDPEDDPGEDFWTFAIQVCGERVLLDGMLPAEVAERVRKAGDR